MWKQRENSLSNVHSTKSQREKFISTIDRNLRKIGHNYGLEDPLGELLKKLSDSMGKQYSGLQDLDDITLEWLAQNTAQCIHELCQQVKTKTSDIIQSSKK